MKLIVFIFVMTIVVQIYAGSYSFDSSEYNSREHSNQSVERELNQLLTSAASGSPSPWQSSAASRPEASWFKTKITQRLNKSSTLSGMTHLKEKLFRMADEKLDKCQNYNTQQLDRNCMGRASGHIMQLIAAVENTETHRKFVDFANNF
ncbi:uncharacterized protein ACRADG_011683 [Cochliomyia hominivorax]